MASFITNKQFMAMLDKKVKRTMAFAQLLLVLLSIFAFLTVMLLIRKKSDRAIDFYQSENQVKHASESEEKVYELQQQLKRSLEVETRPEFAEKKVAEFKLENVDGNRFLSKLGLNLNKTQKWIPSIKDASVIAWLQAYLITTYLERKFHYLTDKSIEVLYTAKQKWIPSIKCASATLTTYLERNFHYLTDKSIEVLHTAKQVLAPDLIQGLDVSYYYLKIYGKWFLSKLGLNLNKTQTYPMTLWQHLSQTLEKKWIPSIKGASATLTTYLEPKIHYLTDKSIEVLYTAKRVLKPDPIQEFDVSYYYLEVNRIMTIAKLHLKKKVQVSLRVMYRKFKAWLEEFG